MRRPIDLCNADLNNATFKNVMFFAIAGSGAMGEPGGIDFYLKSGEKYHMNYVYGDIDIKKVEKLFPILSECRFGMLGEGAVPEKWNYVPLGMGNHLIVHDDMFSEFIKELGTDVEPSEAYMKWMHIAEKILNEDRENEA